MRPCLRAGLLLLLVLASPLPALADDTALNAGAYGPEPVGGGFKGPESSIQMLSEHLDIAFGKRSSDVIAKFVFNDSLPVPARQLIGFPDPGAAEAESERRDPRGTAPWHTLAQSEVGPLEHLQTFVNGKLVPSRLKYGYVAPESRTPSWLAGSPAHGMLMAWHTLWLSFPPDKPVQVERRYHVANGGNSVGAVFFEYIVHTGGAWKGPIRKLVADVTLKDGLRTGSLAWQGTPATNPAKAQWKILSPTHLRLTWLDFEPRTDNARARIALVLPASGR